MPKVVYDINLGSWSPETVLDQGKRPMWLLGNLKTGASTASSQAQFRGLSVPSLSSEGSLVSGQAFGRQTYFSAPACILALGSP